MPTERFETVMSVAMVVAALSVAATVVARYSAAGNRGSTRPSVPAVEAAREIPGWQEIVPYTLPLGGTPGAPVVIVEFTDLECPACRGYHEVLDEVLARRGADMVLRYAAFPLKMHRFGLSAARAMECADSVSRAREWLTAVYRHQDSLGLLGWGDLARRAGISDTSLIVSCATRPRTHPRIDAAMRIGTRHGVEATPTLWVNGLEFRGGLSAERLDSLVVRMADDVRRREGPRE
ncbi:MAG: thioredoxin domain-containing protein [Gemmatimonadetes bacterium]|nr:thioredoxin domain-containing protein [Gemmatimonadota bacterium]